MIKKNAKLVGVTILLAMIAMVVVHTMRSKPITVKSAPNNAFIISAENYIYGRTLPILLGDLEPSDAYINLKLKFRTDSTDGYPNLFQTAPVNRGMRMEILGSTAAIVVPDKSVPGGLRGLTVTTMLKTGQWYQLEVEALNGSYIRVKLDGKDVAAYVGAGIAMETSEILVGGGFDTARIFRGQIDNISLEKGNRPKSWTLLSSPIALSQWTLIFPCVILFLMSLTIAGHAGSLQNGDHSVPETYDLLNSIAIFGFSLIFMAAAIFSTSYFGERNLGMSKWLAHVMLPISICAIFFLNRRNWNIWRSTCWSLGIVFVIYVLYVVRSIGYKENAYGAFILSMYVFWPLVFTWVLITAKNKFRIKNEIAISAYLAIMICALFSALAWSSLVDLTNWAAFRLELDSNFSLGIIGSFFILRIIYYILFESSGFLMSPGRAVEIGIKKKYFDRIIFLDVFLLAVFLWISFRYDSLFVPGSEYHWEYYVGVIEGIRNGGWLLWDTPSQYGFLNIILASLVPTASAWQAMYVFQGTLLFLVSAGIYLAVSNRVPRDVTNRLAIFSIVFMSLFFADPELIGPYPFPSSSVVRFFCVYAMVGVVWLIPKFGLRQAFALGVAWTLAVIWSAESAIYGTTILFFLLVALLQSGTKLNSQLLLTGKYIAIAAACLMATLTSLFLFYQLRLGVRPDLFGYLEHAIGYASGFGYVPFSFSGPGNLLLLVFISVSMICINVIRSDSSDQANRLAPLAAMAGCIWGISTYYIGRPVAQNITAILPIIATVVYLTLLLSRQMANAYTLPIRAAAIPIFFLILIPILNVNWITGLLKTQSFSSNITRGLPVASEELRHLIARANLSEDAPIIYYGDDGVPPFMPGRYYQVNEKNWLPIPLQLLEQPVTAVRRAIYLNRYLCRMQPAQGFLVYRKGDAIAPRLEGFMDELKRFYDVQTAGSGDVYVLYRFSKLNLQYCYDSKNR